MKRKDYPKRLIGLLFGLFLYAVGIVMTVNAEIGYAPWEVFHKGIANVTIFSFGMASICVGLVLLLFDYLMGEAIGIGTILNIILVGTFIDIIMYFGLIPKPENLFFRLIIFFLGFFVIAFASYFYIKAGFGAGPRDSAMVALHRKTNLPIGICRSGIEITVTLLGYILGGPVGMGTVLSALIAGFVIQTVFGFLNFDPKDISHESILMRKN
ncbi:MAG: hypothetical protein Q4P34_02325 [Tissierellia bacterium]|nr:hypothetical protein [Tissierellia bacterium]